MSNRTWCGGRGMVGAGTEAQKTYKIGHGNDHGNYHFRDHALTVAEWRCNRRSSPMRSPDETGQSPNGKDWEQSNRASSNRSAFSVQGLPSSSVCPASVYRALKRGEL